MGVFKGRSLKKSLAAIGTIVIWFIAVRVIIEVPEQVGNVLWPLIVYNSALFGIKKFGQYFNKKEEG